MKLLFILASFVFTTNCFAQKKSYTYKPNLFQASVRVAYVNVNLNLEYRLSPKVMTSADLGYGIVRLQSSYYNRYNENYNGYNTESSNFLNLGREWESLFSTFKIKRIIGSKSRIKYESKEFVNTFGYYGLLFKINGKEFKNTVDSNSFRFRESYQFGAYVGRQVELGKQGNFILDYFIGFGGIANYKFSYLNPKLILGLKIGPVLYRYNKK